MPIPELLNSCSQTINAGLWLIGGRNFAQALVIFDQAIEILMKAELESIHRALVADIRQLNYPILKSLLRDAFRQHPTGKNLRIPEANLEIPAANLEKTITVFEAFDRVSELHPSVGPNRPALEKLHTIRNKIIHFGAESDQDDVYVEQIVTVAIPILDSLIKTISVGATCLEEMIGESEYKQIQVSVTVVSRLKNEGRPVRAYALKTLAHQVLRRIEWPSPQKTNFGHSDWDDYQKSVRKELETEWRDYVFDCNCPICGSVTSAGEYIPALMHYNVDVFFNSHKCIPIAFRCLACGLSIISEEEFLAETFLDPISEELVKAELRAFGEAID